MAEIKEQVVETQEIEEVTTESVEATETVATEPQKPEKEGFKAKAKEWLRKKIVSLKRKTYVIPLIVTLITSFVYLCLIGTFSRLIELNSGVPASGICTFVNTLASILILPLFLNAFPKRHKPRIVYIVAVFIVYALLISMDILFIVNLKSFFAEHNLAEVPLYTSTINLLTVHIVFVCISVVVFATLPLYKKGLNKINTQKELLENNLSGEIDTSAEV